MEIDDAQYKELTEVVAKQWQTIRMLVVIIDQLRQPYNGGGRHDLYLSATNALNELEEEGRI